MWQCLTPARIFYLPRFVRLRRAVEFYLRLVRVFGAGAGVPQLQAADHAFAARQRNPLAAGAGGNGAIDGKLLGCSVAVMNHHMIEENRRVPHLEHDGVEAAFVAAYLDVIVIGASVDVRLAEIENTSLRLRRRIILGLRDGRQREAKSEDSEKHL